MNIIIFIISILITLILVYMIGFIVLESHKMIIKSYRESVTLRIINIIGGVILVYLINGMLNDICMSIRLIKFFNYIFSI